MVNSKTIKVEGKVRSHRLTVLIDNGSTHSFLDEKLAKRLGCKVISTQPLRVTIANGEKMISRFARENFWWEMQGEMFVTDLRLLKLGGCDVVLCWELIGCKLLVQPASISTS